MRHFACFPAEVEAVRGRPRSALIRDLSISGAALLVRVKLVVGTPLRLGLFISRETDEPVVVRGRVVRVKSCGPAAYFWAYRVAVKFDHPVTEHEAEIQAIAREQERVGVAR